MILANSHSYNVDIAKLFGVMTSSMITYIDSEYSSAVRMGLLNKNNTFSIYRSEIYEHTGITPQEQMLVEKSLGTLGVLEVSPFKDEKDRVYYRFLPNVLADGLNRAINAPNPVSAIAMSMDTPTAKTSRITAKERNRNEAKRAIKETDGALRQLLCDWVDAVFARNMVLTPAAVSISEEQLNQLTQTSAKEEVLHIAIKNGYRDISWAISAYNENSKDAVPKNWKSYESMQPNADTKISEESF